MPELSAILPNPITAYARAGALLALVVALGLVVVGVYRAGLQHGRAERDAAVAELKAACLADQRDVAIRSADAYGAALTAQRQRTVAAQRAESGAQVRLSAAVEIIAAKVREVEHARAYVPDLCFPDDLRLRIDAVAALGRGRPRLARGRHERRHAV